MLDRAKKKGQRNQDTLKSKSTHSIVGMREGISLSDGMMSFWFQRFNNSHRGSFQDLENCEKESGYDIEILSPTVKQNKNSNQLFISHTY